MDGVWVIVALASLVVSWLVWWKWDDGEEGGSRVSDEGAGDQDSWNDSLSSPSTFASRFRVEKSNEGLILVNKKDSEDTARVRRTAILFSMSCVPESLGQSIHPGDERWVQLTDSQLDTTIFGIDGDELRYLELNAVHVYPLAEYEERNPREEPDEGFELGERDENQVPGCLYFFPGDWESDDYVGMEVGLQEPHFTRLLEGCKAGGVERVHLSGYFGGHTASYFYEDRPFILLSRESAHINFDSVSVANPAGEA